VLRIAALAAVTLIAQVLPPVQVPPRRRDTAAPGSIESVYGPAQPAELERIARDKGAYQRAHVIVRGVLSDFIAEQYLVLTYGGARVMLIPLDPADYRELRTLLAADVDVTGIVRVLPKSQALVPCPVERVLESQCQDPLLPALPNARPGSWPDVSITVVKLLDRGTGHGPREGPRELADTGIAAAAADGKPVKAVGQFRGDNLCRDLPEPSRREPRDWVLLTSEGPVWVTGRGPQGRGFQLNPAYRGDVGRWLEVTGRVSESGGVLYVRPGNVALIARPPEAETTPCAP
jgi:hypothetical protein